MKNIISLKSFLLGKCAFLIIMLLFSTTFLNAQTVTFAQFFEVNGTNDFLFRNNVSSANFNTIAGGSPIVFVYQNVAGLPAELQGPQAAHIFVFATTTTPAFINAGRVVQPFDQAFTIQILRDTPTSPGIGTGSRTNLLTAMIMPSGSSTSDLSGDNGGSSVGYTASTPNQVITYSSDFLIFNLSGSDRNLALSFSSVQPQLSIGAGGFLTSFSAAGSGTFASNPGPSYNPPTAASAIIEGRVLTPRGRGAARARVVLTNSSGETFTTMTNGFGYFKFSDVESGQTVIINILSKSYVYSPKVLNVSGDLNGFDFYPE